VFGASSYLSFSLPYSCQALHLEAFAVDADGSINTVSFSSALSSATNTTLLSSLAWELQPVYSVLVDNVNSGSAGRTGRGYQVISGISSSSTVPSSPVILPLSMVVSVLINLPLQPTYSSTTLSPITTVAELLSSIIGLAGILAVFRILFVASERSVVLHKTVSSLSRRVDAQGPSGSSRPRRKRIASSLASLASSSSQSSPSPANAAPFSMPVSSSMPEPHPDTVSPGAAAQVMTARGISEERAEASSFSVQNPLVLVKAPISSAEDLAKLSSAQQPPHPLGVPVSAVSIDVQQQQQLWDRMEEDGELWYANVTSGEMAWELPQGALLRNPSAVVGLQQQKEQWERVEEDGELWYVNVASGEVAWELPQGAIVKG